MTIIAKKIVKLNKGINVGVPGIVMAEPDPASRETQTSSRTGAKYLEPLTDLAFSLYSNWNCTTFEKEYLALVALQNQKQKQYNVKYEY